jgi:hypothetical protein
MGFNNKILHHISGLFHARQPLMNYSGYTQLRSESGISLVL